MGAGPILALLASVLSAGAEAEEKAKADVVLRNGKIYTADPARSVRQALAFTGNTIVAVGSDTDVAPLIRIGTFSFEIGLRGIFKLPHRVSSVHIDDLTMRLARAESKSH